MNFEDYLRQAYQRLPLPAIDHGLRVQVDAGGRVWFYIHPQGTDGATLDFRVEGNTLIPHDPSQPLRLG